MIGLRSRFEMAAELARARGEVAQLAASEERLRLARDMHDLTGQSLSTITLKSELASRLLGRLPESSDRDRVRDEIEQVAAVSRQTLRDIREAVSGYRRPTPKAPARSPPASATSWPPRRGMRARRSRSPPSCSCPRAPRGTTCRPASRRQVPATAPRLSALPTNAAGSDFKSWWIVTRTVERLPIHHLTSPAGRVLPSRSVTAPQRRP
jgi:hypothetical protein